MLTVLFATRNGAATLPAVLTAYQQLEVPRGGWKLVVVDNGSTDATRGIVADFQPRLPLTLIVEPAPGKNAALNAGLALIEGDLVVLTDDDALPRRDWLVRLREAADRNPIAGVFGGAVAPRWEVAPPSWLLTQVPLAWTYTVSDPTLAEGATSGRQIFGPNMAVRRTIFDAGHRFDPSIGPNGTRSYAMGSETEFVLRVMGSGVIAYYVPAAIVDHCVRAKQMRRSWVINRMMRAGRCEYRVQLQYPAASRHFWGFATPPKFTPRFAGLSFPLTYRLCRQVASVFFALCRFDKEGAFRATWILSYMFGFTCEAWADQRNRPRPPSGDDFASSKFMI